MSANSGIDLPKPYTKYALSNLNCPEGKMWLHEVLMCFLFEKTISVLLSTFNMVLGKVTNITKFFL